MEAGRPALGRIHTLARICMSVSLLLAAWQGLDGESWLQSFPAMFAMGDGRGGGLRTEPSLLACPLAIYLSLVLYRFLQEGLTNQKRRWLATEAAVFCLATVTLTRSLTVVIIAFCFLLAFGARLRYLITWGAVGVLVAVPLFWDRIQDALLGGGEFTYLITTGVGSWRNVPDILILTNLRQYLLPPNPVQTRETINSLAIMWSPLFAWIENTYSAFSACATTIGVVATAILFGAGIVAGFRKVSPSSHLRLAWVMLYLADWFILPKYEACGWVALGMLTAATSLHGQRVPETSASRHTIASRL
jgi:hypothetical protein